MDILTARRILGLGTHGLAPNDQDVLDHSETRRFEAGTSLEYLILAFTTITNYQDSDFSRQHIPDENLHRSTLYSQSKYFKEGM